MKKSLVLTSENGKEKGVLSIEEKEDMFFGRLRLYNFNEEPKGILSLGFVSNGKVIKAGLTKSGEMLYSFQMEKEDVCDKFSCAVINSHQGKIDPVLFGKIDGKLTKKECLANGLDVFDEPLKEERIEKVLNENNIDFDDELKGQIENDIDKEMRTLSFAIENEKCKECKYRQCFYEEEKSSFYSKLKNQIEKIFDENKTEEYLEKIIPNSKWAKVEYEKNGDYYVIGLIYESGQLAYLCYGVPGVYQKNAPEELSGYPVWLPLDSDKKDGFGYWLVYQNADTGEAIKAIIE